MAQAIAWSKVGGPLPSSDTTILVDDSDDEMKSDDLGDISADAALSDEFDEQIDPETFNLPQADAPKTSRIRVKQKERGRGARVRGD